MLLEWISAAYERFSCFWEEVESIYDDKNPIVFTLVLNVIFLNYLEKIKKQRIDYFFVSHFLFNRNDFVGFFYEIQNLLSAQFFLCWGDKNIGQFFPSF